MRAEQARRLVAPMMTATRPVVVEPELLERLLGSEAQVVERATRRPDSDLTDSSGSTRAGQETVTCGPVCGTVDTSGSGNDSPITGGATDACRTPALMCSMVEEGDLGMHATGAVKPHCTESTKAWPDDAQVNEHFALMLACATAPQEFLVDARVFDAPRVLRGHRLAELELGTKAAGLMDEESKPAVLNETGLWKVRAAIVAHRAKAAKLEARRRLLEGGDTE